MPSCPRWRCQSPVGHALRHDRGPPVSCGLQLRASTKIRTNPRADFPQAALDELAADIRLRGILMPLVVHPADANGRHKLHFGAMRLRAAILAGLTDVPVVVRDAPADRYAQVAENR